MNQLADYGGDSESEEDEVGPPVPTNFRQNESSQVISENRIDEIVGPPGRLPKNEELAGHSRRDIAQKGIKKGEFISEGDRNEDSVSADLIKHSKKKSGPVQLVNIDKMKISKDSDSEENEEDDDYLIGPPIPSNLIKGSEDDIEKGNLQDEIENSDGEEDEASDEEEKGNWLPVSSSMVLRHGDKAVSGLAVDPAGARLATGSIDYEVKLWDFAGMDSSGQAFRTLNPCGNYPVKQLSYSRTGDAILVVSGSAQAKVLDRDGHELMECVKGDRYVSDTARTKGHIAQLTSGCFHPRNREEFMTAGEDGTVRMWNTEHSGRQHSKIIKCRAHNGLRTTPSAITYSRDGHLTAVACTDGSVQIWDNRKMYVRPSTLIREAHVRDSETSCVTYSYAGNLIATRGGDDTLKLWDTRNITKAVFAKDNLFSRYTSTDCCFSPDDTVLVTGTSLLKDETQGKAYFFNVKSSEIIKELIVGESHVIGTQWHPRLRQLFVGLGDGTVTVLYDERGTGRGAELCASKTKTKKKHVEVVVGQQVITPHALPMFRQDKPKSTKKRLEKERLDPIRSRRPDLPIKAGQGGRLAASGSTLSSYVIRNLGLSKRVDDDQDPREAILRYAKEAAENPYWISPAYAVTQPKPIFDSAQETEEPNQEPPVKKTKL